MYQPVLMKECKHPLAVKVGEHDIAIVGWKDFDFDKHQSMVKKLDVFIGLTDVGFKYYELFHQNYVNPLLQSLFTRFQQGYTKLENLIVLEISDGDVDENVYEIVRDLLKDGKRIGFGCYAGHGRTGWLLARLIKQFEKVSGDEAVRRVRKRLCEECVETSKQAEDLKCKKELGTRQIVTPSEGGSWHKKWLRDMEDIKLKDMEEKPDVTPETTSEVIEAWRKQNNNEKLTEEEERLIMEDIARYGH